MEESIWFDTNDEGNRKRLRTSTWTIRSDAETTAQLDDLRRCDRAAVYRYEGTAPCTVALHEDEVGFGVTNDRGAPQAWIEVDDAAIRSWANSWIDGYRDRAHPIDPDDRPT